MAANTTAIQYASRMTYGSAAYDLNRRPVYEVPEEAFRPEVLEQPERQVREKTKTAVRTAENTQGVSLFSVFGMALAAALLVFVLLAYVQLTEVSTETAQLQSELSDLQEEQMKLLVSYEQAFNLNDIEEYATKRLGMVYPTEEQVIHLNSGTGDKAVILEEHTPDTGVLGGFYEFLCSLTEYFK